MVISFSTLNRFRPLNLRSFMQQSIQTFTLSVLLILTAFQYASAAPATVRVNPAVIAMDETVTLTISLDSESLESPDLSVLKDSFQILKKTHSSSIHRDENGITLIRKNWVLTLLPKKKGSVTIPSITIGNEKTAPLHLRVTDKKSSDKTKEQSLREDVYVEVETDIQQAYVQGQVVLTQKIYHTIPLENATLSPPVIENNAAEVISLPQEEPYYWRVKGKRYHVIERSYALFPKHSGTLHIEKADFSGQIKNPKKEDSLAPFSLLTGSTETTGLTQVVNTTTAKMSLTVKSQAESYTGEHWLPAKNITLYSNWSQPLDNLQIGQPVTLQLGIIADGLRAEQLPDIKLEIPQDVKTYVEQADLKNNFTLTGITGVWSQKITLIPAQTKKIQIPEFQLSWWNVITEQQETAILKEQVLSVGVVRVKDNKGEKAGGLSSESKEMTMTASHSDASGAADDNTDQTNESTLKVSMLWLPLLLLFSLLGYLVYRYRRKAAATLPAFPVKTQKKKMNTADKQQFILDSLKMACLENNPEKVQQLLPQWAKAVAEIKPATLEGIGKASHGYMQHEIEQLSRALYAKSAPNWKGVSLWDAVKKYPYPNELLQRQNGRGRLKKMYP